ncbi:MAG: preprotein translocase subunit SecG [Marinicaulis sp.]|nr:preprotein translocase subunit SecG [Marinicaulis sp.]
MTAVILTVHTLIVLGLIVVVLLQRSDGGALGLGGGGGGGGFMSGRGAANALTRTTSILAAAFFATSLGLAIYAGTGDDEETAVEELTGQAAPDAIDTILAPTTDDLLRSVGGDSPTAPEGAAGEGLPLTEQEILDSLGADPDTNEPPTGDNSEENQDNTDTPDE